ncbi:MAG: helix-turn-helix domain-containing protein [Parachlamydiaceae bacterium]
MRYCSPAEKLLIQEITQAAEKLSLAVRGLNIGHLIKVIRQQLGMSQKALAKRAGIPQSTVSRIEQVQRDASLSTINKILAALSCDLLIAPVLREPIDVIRRKQARSIAKKRIHYLKGTMNLEEQQPDEPFIEALLQEEENRLLQGPDHKLWEEQ